MAGPVQGSGSGFWPDYLVGQVNSFIFLNQNDIVLVKTKNKKQKSTGYNRVFDRVLSG